jgi:hypothetical protein
MINCRTCGIEAASVDPAYGKAIDWYRVTMGGDRRITNADVRLGSYCSTDCLLIEVMRTYGLTPNQVRDWLVGTSV